MNLNSFDIASWPQEKESDVNHFDKTKKNELSHATATKLLFVTFQGNISSFWYGKCSPFVKNYCSIYRFGAISTSPEPFFTRVTFLVQLHVSDLQLY